MSDDKMKGYHDQELLIQAFINFLCDKINRSHQIVKGMARQTISDWINEKNTSVKAIKHLQEKERLLVVSAIIETFLGKIRHIITSKFERDNIKKDMLQIYDQWKKTRREDISEDLVSEIANVMKE